MTNEIERKTYLLHTCYSIASRGKQYESEKMLLVTQIEKETVRVGAQMGFVSWTIEEKIIFIRFESIGIFQNRRKMNY